MSAVKATNLALKFLLELAAFAAFAWRGSTVGTGAVSVVVAVAAPLLAIVLWGAFAAPRARRRLPLAARAPFELAVLGLAAVALGVVDSPAAGVAFGLLVVVNAVLLTAFDQWEL
jgi:hypothetical protein